jgi:signal transduction histidine kinase
VARAVGGETDLDRILTLIAKRGRALVDAGSVLILLAEGGDLVVAASAGELADEPRGERVPIDGSLIGQVLRSATPQRLAGDIGALPLGGLAGPAGNAMLVPLVFRGQSLGVLAGFDRLGGGPFGDDDERLLLAFAASAATAVATAQLAAEERIRHAIEASEQERGRWARELHDETLQAMAGLQLLLRSALQRGSPQELDAAVHQALDLLGVETENLRSLIAELRPAALDQIGLAPALQSLAERTESAQGLIVDLQVDLGDDGRLAPEIESTLYRLVQEALTNVGKHAGAEHAHVVVQQEDDSVSVLVRDDGAGFDPTVTTGGFGLRGMRERVALAGGDLSIESAAPDGTVIRATIPVGFRA